MQGPLRIIVLSLIGAIFCACVTTRDRRFKPVDELVQSGNFESARKLVENNKDRWYHKRDRLLFYLETGMLAFYQADYEEAIEHLNEAERLIEEYYAVSVSQEIGSFFLGESVRIYPGEGYEDLYVNVFKTLAFLMLDDYEGAFVEVRKMDLKLRLLEQRYENEIQQYNTANQRLATVQNSSSVFLYGSALARFLSLMLYRGEGNVDDARIDQQKLQTAMALQPELYPRAFPSDIKLELSPEPLLTVFAHTGLTPLKDAVSIQFVVSSQGMFISAVDDELAPFMDTIGTLNASLPSEAGSFRLKVEIPYLRPRPTEIRKIQVSLNDQVVENLFPLENLEKVALLNHERRLPLLILRAVTAGVIKGTSSLIGSNEAATMGGSEIGALVSLIAEILTSVSQKADLRIPRYFPATVFAGEYSPEEADEYRVRLEFLGANNQLMDVQEYNLEPAQQMIIIGNSLR